MSNLDFFHIKIIRQGWLNGHDPEGDLCSHGLIKPAIGGQKISSEEME